MQGTLALILSGTGLVAVESKPATKPKTGMVPPIAAIVLFEWMQK